MPKIPIDESDFFVWRSKYRLWGNSCNDLKALGKIETGSGGKSIE